MDSVEERKIFDLAEKASRKNAVKVISQIKFNNFYHSIVPMHTRSNWDYEIIDKLTKKVLAIIEIKNRTYPSTYEPFTTEGFMLEVSKYNVMLKEAINKNIDAFFVTLTSDNMAFVWDMKKASKTDGDKDCPKETVIDKGRQLKNCVFFKMNEAFIAKKLD